MVKLKRQAILVLSTILFFTAAAFCVDESWKFVVRVAGVVQCQKAGQEKWVSIWNGRMLQNGDKAKTMKDSRAKILLPDNSFFILGAGTTLEMAKIEYTPKSRYVQLKLDAGKVRVKVEKFVGKDSKFEVVTPRAVLAARGTEFFVQQDPPSPVSLLTAAATGCLSDFLVQGPPAGVPGATHLLVFSGNVDFTSQGGSATFGPGQGGMVDTQNRMSNDSGLQGGGQGGTQGGTQGGSGTGADTGGTGTSGTTGDTAGGTGTGAPAVDGDLSAPGTSYGGGIVTGGSTGAASGGTGHTFGDGSSVIGTGLGGTTPSPPSVPSTNTTKGSIYILIQ